jgi:hypothetical protein
MLTSSLPAGEDSAGAGEDFGADRWAWTYLLAGQVSAEEHIPLSSSSHLIQYLHLSSLVLYVRIAHNYRLVLLL